MELSIIWRHLIHFGPRHRRRASAAATKAFLSVGGAGVAFSRDILIFYTCPSRSTHLQTSIEADQIIYSRLGFGVRWKSQTRRGEALGGDVSIDGLTCSLL